MKPATAFALAALFFFSGWMWSRHYHQYLYETEFKVKVDHFNRAVADLRGRYDDLWIKQHRLLIDYREVSCR